MAKRKPTAKEKRGTVNPKSSVPVRVNTETVQQSVPIIAVHKKYDLIETYPGCFVKSYLIGDNNYLTAPEDEQKTAFLGWRKVINSFGANMEFALTVNNRNINQEDFRDSVLMKETGDAYDHLRKQMNKIILDRMTDGRNSIQKDKYLTVAIHVESAEKAASVFHRLDRETDKALAKIGSGAKVIPLEERLEILYGLYNDPSEHFITKSRVFDDDGKTKEIRSFDFAHMRSMGLTINDLISPPSIQIERNKMRLGNKFVRVLRLTQMPSQMSDEFITNVTDMPFNCLTTINYKAIPATKADALVSKNLSLVRDQKTKQIRQGQKQGVYDDSYISPDLLDREAEALALRDDMHEKDERLFETVYTIAVFADDEFALDQYTDTLVTEYKKASATVNVMVNQQEEGFNTTLPLCYNQVMERRTLKSSSAAIMLPFSILELNDPGGINYSCNLLSKNLLVYDRLSSNNYNGFILGTPGCFTGETEILVVDDDHADDKDFLKYTRKETIQNMMAGSAKYSIVSCHPLTGDFVVAKGRHVRKVKDVHDLAIVHLSNGETVRCTIDHLWMTPDGFYKQAKDLEAGMALKSVSGDITVKSVEIKSKLPMPVPVFDLEQENRDNSRDYENYTLGSGVVVHNSGKSFTSKVEMLSVFLKSNADIVVIDPEDEYTGLAEMLGGEVIKIVPGGDNHINPMEIVSQDYEIDEETSPINAKADFILRLCECIVKSPFGINSVQETVIDECVHKLFDPFVVDGKLRNIPADQMPTLNDLQKMLAEDYQKVPEARELALALKLYTGNGSLNVFGTHTNVNTHSRFVVYQIRDVGDRLKNLAMLTILDHIWNQIVRNRQIGKATWFYVDEIYLLFQNEYSASFLNTLFRRARKYLGVPTGITQNVTPLLESPTARDMLQNCCFIQILAQAGPDRERLQEILNLSDAQLDYITSSPKGQGLLYTGRSVVPFYSVFPKTGNDIYKVLTTDRKELNAYRAAEKREQARKAKAEKGFVEDRVAAEEDI